MIVPPGRYRLTSRVHISRGAVLFFLGGEFVLATGATLIVEGHVCAPPVPIIRLAGGAVSGSPQNAAIDVDWFGADTTGSIPCDEAIASALRLAISPRPPRGARQLRFGPGTYRVTRNSIFMPGAAPEPVVGLSICGAGAETTAIVLSPAEKGAHYFFANPRDVICARTWSIRDISLEADTSSPFASAVNGFLFGRDYNFSYQNVQVRVPGTVWHVAGTQLGSEHRFINCFLSGHRVVLLDNQQAVNTQFTATDAWATGPLLDVRRGGLISWIGGSIALLGKDPAGSFLRTEEQGFAGYGGNSNFVSINIEIYNPAAKLIDCQGAHGQFRGRFESCKFWPAMGERRVMFQFRRGNHVVFRDCTFDAKSLFDIGGLPPSFLQPKAPAHAVIGFESCTGISRDQVTYSGALTADDGIARVYSRGSTFEVMPAQFEGERIARDFDLNWRDGAGTTATVMVATRKLVHVAKAVSASRKPHAGVGSMTLTLPHGATLLGIHLRKSAADSADPHKVRLVAWVENVTTPLLVSEWAAMSAELQARVSFDLLTGPILTGARQRLSCAIEADDYPGIWSGAAKVECIVEYI